MNQIVGIRPVSLRLWTGALLAALIGSLLSCARINPRHDYQRTGQLITEHTGAVEVYDPEADALITEKVNTLLADGLTADEAVAVALLNNRAFQSMFYQIGASRADVVQSQLLSNPSLGVSLTLPEGGGRSKLNVGFAQQLVDLWQIPVRKQIAEAELEQTVLGVASRAVELTSEVRTQCYQLLAWQNILQVARENRALLDQSRRLVQSQLQAGMATQLDVNLARMNVLEMDSELISLEREQDVTRSTLGRLLGLSRQEQAWNLADTLPMADSLPTETDLLTWAIKQRLDAQASTHAVRVAEQDLRRECLNVFPSIAAGFEMERSEERALPGRKILADTARESIAAGRLTAPSIQSRAERDLERRQIIDLLLGPTIELTLPIWDQNQAPIAKARYTVIQRRKDFEYLLDTVADEVSKAAQILRHNRELVHFYREQTLPLAADNLNAARRSFQAGQQNILVLIDAQRSLIARQREYINTQRDCAVALAELEKAVGGQLPEQATTRPTDLPTSGPAGP